MENVIQCHTTIWAVSPYGSPPPPPPCTEVSDMLLLTFTSSLAKSIVCTKSVCTDLGPGQTLITWPTLKGYPDFKDRQTLDAPDVLLALFLKKLTIPLGTILEEINHP